MHILVGVRVTFHWRKTWRHPDEDSVPAAIAAGEKNRSRDEVSAVHASDSWSDEGLCCTANGILMSCVIFEMYLFYLLF